MSEGGGGTIITLARQIHLIHAMGVWARGESHPPGISHLNKGPIAGIKGQKKVKRQSLQKDTDTPMPAPGAELTLAGLQYNFMMGDGAMVRFVRDTRH